jgi:hypothetical protein
MRLKILSSYVSVLLSRSFQDSLRSHKRRVERFKDQPSPAQGQTSSYATNGNARVNGRTNDGKFIVNYFDIENGNKKLDFDATSNIHSSVSTLNVKKKEECKFNVPSPPQVPVKNRFVHSHDDVMKLLSEQPDHAKSIPLLPVSSSSTASRSGSKNKHENSSTSKPVEASKTIQSTAIPPKARSKLTAAHQHISPAYNPLIEKSDKTNPTFFDRNFATSSAIRDFNESMPMIVLPSNFEPRRGQVVISNPSERVRELENEQISLLLSSGFDEDDDDIKV